MKPVLAVLPFILPGLLQREDADIIEMLRDAQVTNRAELKQGRCRVRLVITREQREGSAVVEGELTWIEDDFLLKFKVTDPSHVFFRQPEDEFGADWDYILRRRDGVRIYNSRSRQLSSRSADPASFDSLFHLNPWVQIFTCCPPDAVPPAGRPWVEIIGPHPAMKEVMNHSKFEFEHLPDGGIRQIRRDRKGTAVEIVFPSADNFQVGSSLERDPRGVVTQSVRYRYQRAGRATLPVECEAWRTGGHVAPRAIFTYQYSNWDVKSRVPPGSLSFARFSQMVRGLQRQGGKTPEKKKSGVDEKTLRRLSEELRGSGFAHPG